MVFRHSTRRALQGLGKTTRSVLMFTGLAACTVYDGAALGRKTSSASEPRREQDAGHDYHHDATIRVQTAVGCEGEECVTTPNDSASDAAVVDRDAASDRAAPAQPAQPDQPDEDPPAVSRDAATPPLDSGPSDAGVKVAQDAGVEAESGFCSACDSRPARAPVLSDNGGTGNVTTYGSVTSPSPSAGGACNYGAAAIDHYAAINVGDANGQWQGGRICGQCAAVRVKTPEGWRETVVRIVDKCADANCGIAVSGAAARELMGDRPGRYDGEWRFVSCAGHPEVSDGAPSLHVKEGSSTWWALVHVRNPAQAVSAIDWQSVEGSSTGSFAYATEAENFYSIPEAIHNHGMVRLTVHYRDKTQVEVALSPSQLAQPNSDISLP